MDECNGEPPIEFPATIAGMQATLTGERPAEFAHEIGRTAGQDLTLALFRWPYPDEQRARDDAASDRLAAAESRPERGGGKTETEA
ncbi:hypothetical protein [Streptomyces sp. NPDC088789]|uniref:hypothetical protein n=1 Tax=Streptomyces sp. NPDC088789 TaxID=3365899 RepID=UPI003829B893